MKRQLTGEKALWGIIDEKHYVHSFPAEQVSEQNNLEGWPLPAVKHLHSRSFDPPSAAAWGEKTERKVRKFMGQDKDSLMCVERGEGKQTKTPSDTTAMTPHP